MTASGWQEDRFRVIAIDPEIEVWMWQDNVHVATALRYRGSADLRRHLRENDWWPEGVLKPPSPKEAMEWLLRSTKRRRSSAVYREIASKISLRRCQDPALQQLTRALREWFPPFRPY